MVTPAKIIITMADKFATRKSLFLAFIAVSATLLQGRLHTHPLLGRKEALLDRFPSVIVLDMARCRDV